MMMRIEDIPSLLEIFLGEEVGKLPELDKYAEDFKQAYLQKANNFKYYRGPLPKKMPTIQITEKDFSSIQNPFYRKLTIQVQTILIGEKGSQEGLYNLNTKLLKKKQLLSSLEIILLFQCNIDDFEDSVDRLASDFRHELTHAYFDYQTRKSSMKQGMDFGIQDRTKDWYKKLDIEDEDSEPVTYLKGILYHINKVERPAFVAEASGEALRIFKQGITDPNEIYKTILKDSQVGTNYRWIKKKIQELQNSDLIENWDIVEKPGWKEDFVQTWNSLRKKKAGSFSEAVEFLNDLWKKYSVDFRNRVGKVIYSVTNEQNNN